MSEAVNSILGTSPAQSAQMPRAISTSQKVQRYNDIRPFIQGLLMDQDASALALMAGVLSILHNAFDTFFWTGFYRRISDDTLEVGPNQGTLGCTSIRFGRGVCGTVAATQRTKIVADVHAEPNHIGCDAHSQSEIVVPLFIDGKLAAVLDIDSTIKGAFDQTDQEHLERLMDMLGQALSARDLRGLMAL